MDHNLQITFSYKDLLLKKLYYSVTCSVLSQLFLLFLYVILVNIDVLHPLQWASNALSKLTAFTTWIYLLPFILIIFAQCIVCAKDYVFQTKYCSTRFQKLMSVFSMRNFMLLNFHLSIGGCLAWHYLSFSQAEHKELFSKCPKDNVCLNTGAFFLISGGVFTGFYYFTKISLIEKHLNFPVIRQSKILQLKFGLLPLFKESLTFAVYPTLYHCFLYLLWSHFAYGALQSIIEIDEVTFGLQTYFYLWLFGGLYCFSMNLMRFFFNVFLTEPVSFPLNKTTNDSLTLQSSILLNEFPIVQNLACLDLFLLTRIAKLRSPFYSLSQPGGHPHNWNSLVENVLKLFAEYTETLNRSTQVDPVQKQPVPVQPIQVLSPIQSPDRFRNMRSMSSTPNSFYNVTVTPGHPPMELISSSIKEKLVEKLNNILNFIKIITGVNYLFGDLPQANIQKCLGNGHLIIWTSQGISELICASLKEDSFGIVQKDLPVLLSSLVHLKQSLDKLNKMPVLSRKVAGYDDFNYRMKGAINVAVKRSLFNICFTFAKYINEFPLNKDVKLYLQSIIKA